MQPATCHPRDREPQWLLRYDDPERGDAVYYSEAEAQAAYETASLNWTVTLFSPAIRPKPETQPVSQELPTNERALTLEEWITEADAMQQLAEKYIRECGILRAELAKLKSVDAESAWIDVNQELPEYGQLCIMLCNGIVQHALYSLDDESGNWQPFDEDFDQAPFNTFSHWQPIPAAPLAGRGDKL